MTIRERWMEWQAANPELGLSAYEGMIKVADEAGVQAAEIFLVMVISHALDIHPAEVAAEVLGDGVQVRVLELGGDGEPVAPAGSTIH